MGVALALAPAKVASPHKLPLGLTAPGSQRIILQPRHDLNILGVLTGNTFTPSGSKLLPQQPSGYLELQHALRTSGQMAW
jgi:hypothetical protein